MTLRLAMSFLYHTSEYINFEKILSEPSFGSGVQRVSPLNKEFSYEKLL